MKNLQMLFASLITMVMSAFVTTSYAAIAATDLAPIATSVGADLAVIVVWAMGLLAIILAPKIGFKLLKGFANSSA